jgi:YtcA family
MSSPAQRNCGVYVLALAPLLLGGCMRSPTVDILGSFFPAWLICFAVAVLLTALCRFLLMRYHMKFDLPVLVYPSLTAIFTCSLWLIFFY